MPRKGAATCLDIVETLLNIFALGDFSVHHPVPKVFSGLFNVRDKIDRDKTLYPYTRCDQVAGDGRSHYCRIKTQLEVFDQ